MKLVKRGDVLDVRRLPSNPDERRKRFSRLPDSALGDLRDLAVESHSESRVLDAPTAKSQSVPEGTELAQLFRLSTVWATERWAGGLPESFPCPD